MVKLYLKIPVPFFGLQYYSSITTLIHVDTLVFYFVLAFVFGLQICRRMMKTYHKWTFFIGLRQHLPTPHHILGVITQIVIDHLMSPLCCGLQHSLQIMTPSDDDDRDDEDDNRHHDDDVFLILNIVYTEKGFRLVAWHMILWWASVGKTCRKNIWNNILHFQSTSISSLRCLSFNNYRAIP